MHILTKTWNRELYGNNATGIGKVFPECLKKDDLQQALCNVDHETNAED